jgi:hypothetical protein
LTETVLTNANAICSRIKEINSLIEELNLTDPSGRDETIRHSPITIQAGMGKVVNFELTNNINQTPTIVQELDNKTYKLIYDILLSYRRTLEAEFKKL